MNTGCRTNLNRWYDRPSTYSVCIVLSDFAYLWIRHKLNLFSPIQKYWNVNLAYQELKIFVSLGFEFDIENFKCKLYSVPFYFILSPAMLGKKS